MVGHFHSTDLTSSPKWIAHTLSIGPLPQHPIHNHILPHNLPPPPNGVLYKTKHSTKHSTKRLTKRRGKRSTKRRGKRWTKRRASRVI